MYRQNRNWSAWGLAAVLIVAALIRGQGVYRGITHDAQFHPDAPRQVHALGRYLDHQYIWYTGSRFDDGYPLFLKHFDEWLVRPLRAAGEVVSQSLGIGGELDAPNITELYFWAMTLRWFYGVVVVLLAWLFCRRLGYSHREAFAVAFLIAISPLSIVVSHYGTGDMACDLFFAAMILCCAVHAQSGRPAWLGIAGLSAGFAFTGKYNAGLAVLAIAAYVVIISLARERDWRGFLTGGVIAAIGFFAGIAIAMPQFLWAPERTLEDVLVIIAFIKDYGVPQEFLDKPFHERAWIGLSTNLPRVLGSMGWAIVSSAVIGLVLAVVRWFKLSADDEGFRRQSLLVVLFAFPWAVILISLMMKRNVHLFYFSWVYPCYIAAAVYGLYICIIKPRKWVTYLILLALLGFESAARLPQELFFWGREDVVTLVEQRVSNRVLDDLRLKKLRYVESADKSVKDFLLEPVNIAHFRNRPAALLAGEVPDWTQMNAAPLPHIPFAAPIDWILLNGPVLPRHDAIFRVESGKEQDLVLVATSPLEDCRIGIRSGIRPAHVSVDLSGDERATLTLGADDWLVHETSPEPFKVLVDDQASGRTNFYYRLRVKSRPGDVWVHILRSEREVKIFRLFSGEPGIDYPALFEGIDSAKLERLVSSIHYREGSGFEWGTVEAGRAVSLWGRNHVLPAGIFRIDLNLVGMDAENVFTIRLTDRRGRASAQNIRQTFQVGPGSQRVSFRFQKHFVPYECELVVEVEQGGAVIGEWKLYPDVMALHEAAHKGAPAWSRPISGELNWDAAVPFDVSFGRAVRFRRIDIPATLTPGQTARFGLMGDLLKPSKKFREWDAFIHYLNEQGQVAWSVHMIADHIAFHPEDFIRLELPVPQDLTPGTYRARLGFFNRRTQQKMRITECAANDAFSRDGEYVLLGDVDVKAGEGSP